MSLYWRRATYLFLAVLFVFLACLCGLEWDALGVAGGLSLALVALVCLLYDGEAA